MKKILIAFFVGQMLLISLIFNQSIYDIYTINNKGEQGLETWNIENANAQLLGEFYDYYNQEYSDYSLQIIKMPISEKYTSLYEIYHNHMDRVKKQYSVTSDTEFKYYPLEREEFIDSNGVFASNLSEKEIWRISDRVGANISRNVPEIIPYEQIIRNNVIQFFCLLLLTQIMLIINAILGIKGYAVKKILGFSSRRILVKGFSQICMYNIISYIISFLIHIFYLIYINKINTTYLLLLGITLAATMVINFILYWFSQPFVNLINVKDAIKNSIYSNRLNNFLFITKLVLIFVISGMISISVDTYQKYKISGHEMERYVHWNNLYTSDGYNSDEYDKLMNHPDELKKVCNNVAEVKEVYEKQRNCYLISANATQYLEAISSNEKHRDNKEILNSYEENYIVANKQYIEDFCEIVSENGEIIQPEELDSHTILVPESYQPKEQEILAYYKSLYEELYNYDMYYGLENSKVEVDDLSIRYIKNNQRIEVLNYSSKSVGKSISNAIIVIDNGKFGSSYYFEMMGGNGLFFRLADRNELKNELDKYGLNSLLNVVTLLTPYYTLIDSYEFILRTSITFSILFIFTLLFIIYASNYIDMVINRKALGVKILLGFNRWDNLKTNLMVTLILLICTIPMIFLPINSGIYLGCILVDLATLLFLYDFYIRRNIVKIIKGGI